MDSMEKVVAFALACVGVSALALVVLIIWMIATGNLGE